MTGLNTYSDRRNPASSGQPKAPSGQQIQQRNMMPSLYPTQKNKMWGGLAANNKPYEPPATDVAVRNAYNRQNPEANYMDDAQGGGSQSVQTGDGTGLQLPTSGGLDAYSQNVQDVVNDPTTGVDVAPVLSSNIAHFLNPANPINKQLQQLAVGQANRRGLANSSIAIGAGQEAVLNRASQLGIDATAMGNENWARNLGFSKSAVDDTFRKDVTTAQLSQEDIRLRTEMTEAHWRNELAKANVMMSDAQRNQIYSNIKIDEGRFQLDKDKFVEEKQQNLREDSRWWAEFDRKYDLMADKTTAEVAEIEAKIARMGFETDEKTGELIEKPGKNPELVKDFRIAVSQAFNNWREAYTHVMSSQFKGDSTARRNELNRINNRLKTELNIQRRIFGLQPITDITSEYGYNQYDDSRLAHQVNFFDPTNWDWDIGGSGEEDEDEDDA